MIDFQNELAEYVFKSKYARYVPELKRRETWDETVGRVEAMHLERYSYLPEEDLAEIRWAFDMVRQKMVLPSMRSMQFGGKAIFAHEARIYNCAVRIIDSPRAFAEVMYLLLCGCGVGIGVFKKYTERLPNLVNAKDKTGSVFVYTVEDNIEGWADSIEALLNCYFKNNPYSGKKIVFDYSKIRPAGAPLKTGGGKAPGYEPLKAAHQKIKKLLDYRIERKKAKRLRGIDIYDILMFCSDAVLAGGVRRSATIVVFDKDDKEMMGAKTLVDIDGRVFTGVSYYKHSRVTNQDEIRHKINVEYKDEVVECDLSDFEYQQLTKDKKISWLHVEPQRARSNNSVLLVRDQVTEEEFAQIIENTKLWGEPGFVFANVANAMPNPCVEIMFVPVTDDGQCGVQFCNLTTINGGVVKDIETFKKCVKAATLIGTLQAGYTSFPYLSRAAQKLTEEEALLGVSITGILDSPEFFLNQDNLVLGSTHAVQVNEEWAKKIGIRPSARITCVKPEGSSTLVLKCFGSGAGPGHAKPKFLRRVQANKLENVYRHFHESNPHATEESVWSNTGTDDVISFPINVPENVMTKDDLTAIQHLDIIKMLQKCWVKPGTTEHNKKPITHSVSCTVVVKDNEWDRVIKHVYKNKNFFAAVSFIGELGDKAYPQAPNEKMVTEGDIIHFDELQKNWKAVDYDTLIEEEDMTEVQNAPACAGGACQIV